MSEQTSRSKRRLIGVIVAIAAAGGMGGWLTMGSAKPAPDVNMTTITGEVITPASLRGKVAVINFWATSCTTCVKEMPMMAATYQKYRAQGLEFVAVAMSYDPPNYVLNFTETRQLPFKVALDAKGEVAAAYGDVKLTPTTYVISKDGKILKRYVGEPDEKAFHALIEQALKA